MSQAEARDASPKRRVVHFKPRPLQPDSIASWLVGPCRHALVQAVAGAGKSFLLEHWLLPKLQGDVLYLAFNTHVIEEANEFAPNFSGLTAQTISSLSHEMLPAKKVRMELDWKFKHFRKYFPKYRDANAAVKLMEYVQNTGPFRDLTDDLLLEAGIDVSADQAPPILKKVHKCLKELLGDYQNGIQRQFNHTDVMWLAAYYPARAPSKVWKWIVLDEVQDLNATEQKLLQSLVVNGTRCFVVGDPEQILYSFKGVREESVTSLSSWLRSDGGIEVFESNVCRRCPQLHVRLAQFCVPSIRHIETAAEGTVRRFRDLPLPELRLPDTMLIAYNAAPIIRLAYRLVKAGIPSAIVGEAPLQRELLSFLEPHRAEPTARVIQLSASQLAKTKKRLFNSGNGPRAHFCEEFHKAVVALLDSMSVDEAVQFVVDVFKDSVEADIVRCTTIHKSKGSTCEHTWLLLNDEPVPVEDDWSPEQRHVLYVSLTRAKRTLNFVSDPQGLQTPASFLDLLPPTQ